MSKQRTRPSEDEVFGYLDALRLSGETNMFGAARFLVAEFGFSRPGAKRWLVKWMETFEELPPERNADDNGAGHDE